MSERTSSTITLPWATQEDVDDFFAPPTKPVKPLFVASYLLAQLFFFIALLGLRAINPALTTEEATTLLQNTSTPLSNCDRDSCGTGIINATAAVDKLTKQSANPGDGRAHV